ncbi:MAG: ABC transporter ATP-binding protein [Candidatus Thermoplasmatota archaeon]|jgi:peptide/nickel transport system ATP-binding protein|nr:ABC transporter ATP-binding protein [Candidatus Thermoplasmatota archaeon]
MLLTIRNLSVFYNTVVGKFKVIEDMNLDLEEGDIISLVGESASGKSTLGQVLTRMLPGTGSAEGEVIFDGKDVLKISENRMTEIRGTSIFMIFQNPLNSLNPVKTVGFQLIEAARIRRERDHLSTDEAEMRKEAEESLISLRLPDADSIMRRYPHELSGGQVQRVVICMALLLKPKILIADEPTTALDVTIQAQVINLLRTLNKEMKMTIIFITHDIGLAYVLSNNLVVLYSGRIMESGNTESIIKKPLHPYTSGLIGSIPNSSKTSGKLFSIKGSPPSYLSLPDGCKFSNRCQFVFERCMQEEPKLLDVQDRKVKCWLYE